MSLSMALRQAIVKFQNKPPVSALEEYQGSILQYVVDAVADLAKVERDEDGSFSATIKSENEALSFIFKRKASPDDQSESGIALAFTAIQDNEFVPQTEENGTTECKMSQASSGQYNLHGEDIRVLKVKLSTLLPFVDKEEVMPLPDRAGFDLLSVMSKGAPDITLSVIKQANLEIKMIPKKPPFGIPKFGR